MSTTKRIIICAVAVWLGVSFSRIGFAEAVDNETRAARTSALKDLITSAEGTPKEPTRIFKTKDGYLRFIGAAPSTHFAVEATKRGTAQDAANAFLERWRNLFVNESPSVEFQRIRVKTQKERSYVRYQQMYAGLEVFGAEMIVQVNSSGGIDAVISDIMRDTSALDTKKVSLEPAIDALTAQKNGIEFLSGQYENLKFEASAATLMIYAPEVVGNSGGPRLVWQMEVGNIGEPLVKELMLVDAHNGEVAFHYSLICSAMHREIWDYEGTYYAVLKRTEGQDPCGIPDVDLAYDYLGDTYHFYDVNHSRDSYDGNGAVLDARVRYDTIEDAWWMGTFMRIGPGFVTDDIVGHEFTHGVTLSESHLIYSGESGAINESFSDMWGEWIDQTNGDGNDTPEVKWYLGEDTPIGSFRCMKNPPDFNCSPYYTCDRQHPDYYKRPGYWYEGTEDLHFVHHNNGVGNKLCYLLTDGDMFRGYIVTGMGIEKTADLFYECQTNLLTSASNYYGLGCVLTQAAINLHFSDPNRENVKEACRAVGILASGDVIYVDRDANGYNNGTSWDDAYTDLQDAFIAARCPEVNAVWVAAGTYKPTTNPADSGATFELIDGVDMYGHFGGVGTYEASPDERNLADANNETILDGQIGNNDYDAVTYVVTAEDINNAIVDGFTIRGSYSGAGVSLSGANVTLVNCKLKENCKGIDITNNSHPSHPYIHNCFFTDNSSRGISCGSYSEPVITNSTFDGNNITQYAICANWSDIELTDCIVKNHAYRGIEVSYTDIKINNSVIERNSYTGLACSSSSTLNLTDSVIRFNGSFGIRLENISSATIENSLIHNNLPDSYGNNGYGVYCENSSLIINHSVIERNSYIGLCCLSYSTLDLTNSVIRFNGSCGVCLIEMSSPTIIKNNWIHNNLSDIYDNYGYGIYIYTPVSAIIRNNTIVHNADYGIYLYSGSEPNISNCIIWENDAGQLYNCSATYSRTTDPNFMNPDDPNDLHIDVNSPCKNAGNPNSNYDGETDIDGEDRVKYGRVDIGGDEYYLSPADFDDDLIVNFRDYAIFADAWDSNDSDSKWNPDCNIGTPVNNLIDYADLVVFCEDWLWQAGWTKTFTCGAGQGMSRTMAAGFAPAEVSYPSVLAEQQIEKVEPIKIEQLIKWLEELWLDPEVRKLIDEDVWLKFIDSLKEDLQSSLTR